MLVESDVLTELDDADGFGGVPEELDEELLGAAAEDELEDAFEPEDVVALPVLEEVVCFADSLDEVACEELAGFCGADEELMLEEVLGFTGIAEELVDPD